MTKLVSKDFKTDTDWWNFGDKVANRWKSLRIWNDKCKGKKERHPNCEAMKILQSEFNASQNVINKAIQRYCYSGKFIGDEI